jgi:hypothetical protein
LALSYSIATKNARMRAVLEALQDQEEGRPVLVIGTLDMAKVLARITLENPAGTVSHGVLRFSGLPLSAVSEDDGTAAAAQLQSAAGATIVSDLSVGTSGTDLILATTTVHKPQTVTLDALSITHA